MLGAVLAGGGETGLHGFIGLLGFLFVACREQDAHGLIVHAMANEVVGCVMNKKGDDDQAKRGHHTGPEMACQSATLAKMALTQVARS